MNIFKKLLRREPEEIKPILKGVLIDDDLIRFENSKVYTNQKKSVGEILLSEIKEIRIDSQDVDVAYTEHLVLIKIFDNSDTKDFLIYNKEDIKFAKRLFAALHYRFRWLNSFSTRKEMNKVIYKRVK